LIWLIWFVLFIWLIYLNRTIQIDQINKRNHPDLAFHAPRSITNVPVLYTHDSRTIDIIWKAFIN
jgi:hypothetical protein